MLLREKEHIEGLCSVIMPTYNSEKYIEIAIRSVLAQTYGDIELIVVDDCSSDNTTYILEKLTCLYSRIKYFKLDKNSGCAYARNFGLEKSQGEYIAFLDSDDSWTKDKLAKQIAVLKDNKQFISVTAYQMIDADNNLIKNRHVKQKISYTDLLKENSIIFSSVVCKFDDIKYIYFKDDWYHEDYMFLLDCLHNGLSISGIDAPMVFYRVHSAGRSFNKFKAAKFRWKIYREFLKMNFLKSSYYFFCYAVNGIKKYN